MSTNSRYLIDRLERQYKSFIDEESHVVFLNGISDYLNILTEKHPEFGPIIRDLILEQKRVNDKFDADVDEYSAKLNCIYKEIKIEIASSNLLVEYGLLDLISKQESVVASSQTPVRRVYDDLKEIEEELKKIAHENIFKKYYLPDFADNPDTLIQNFEKSYQEYKLWKKNSCVGALETLLEMQGILLSDDVILNQYVDPEHFLKSMYVAGNINAINNIEKFDSQGSYNRYDKRRFKVYINRVHHHLLSKLSAPSDQINGIDMEQGCLKLVYDLKDFTISISQDPNKKFCMKTEKGEFKKIGKALHTMLLNLGEPCLPNSEYEQTIKNLWNSLHQALDLRPSETSDLFFRKENFWGVNKNYFLD